MKPRPALFIVPVFSLMVMGALAPAAAVAQEQTPVPPAPPEGSAPVPALTPQTAAGAAGETPIEAINYPNRLLSGFGDVVYSSSKNGAGYGTGSNSGRQFSLGQLTLQYTSAIATKTFVFTEVTYSARSDAGQGNPPATGYNVEVERLFLRYDQSDQLKISAGRYHTPINWWNTAFHHGLWLQTTIARPEMTRFGGQFIPSHFVGALIEGAIPTPGLNLNYNAGVGNGRASVVSRAGDAGDNNGAAATLLNLFVRPDRLYGLQIGGAVYEDRVPVTTVTPANGDTPSVSLSHTIHETILSGHIVYQKENPEVIAEYAHIRHTEGGQAATNNDAYYLQVAYRRPGSLFKPYYRYEKMTIASNDLVLTSTPNLTGNTVGIRYDFTELAALKLEYRDMQRSPGSRSYGASTTGVFAQVSFAF